MARSGKSLFGAALVLLGIVAVGAQSPPVDWRGVRPSVVVEMEPGTDTGAYEAYVTISDLRDGRVLAQPRLQVQAGSSGAIEAGIEGAVTLRLEIGVDSTATRATWSFELRDGGVLMTEQRATLTLARPREAAY